MITATLITIILMVSTTTINEAPPFELYEQRSIEFINNMESYCVPDPTIIRSDDGFVGIVMVKSLAHMNKGDLPPYILPLHNDTEFGFVLLTTLVDNCKNSVSRQW